MNREKKKRNRGVDPLPCATAGHRQPSPTPPRVPPPVAVAPPSRRRAFFFCPSRQRYPYFGLDEIVPKSALPIVLGATTEVASRLSRTHCVPLFNQSLLASNLTQGTH